jgi:glycosyltransferase involved in cell wall biosynthesis
VSEPTVTVLVCAYDYERYLPEALDGALAQRYPADRLEVLVVDDGSTDGTPELLAGYGDRIRVIRQANAGLKAATARGLAAATGDLVAILDADDAWHRDKVRRQVDLLTARPELGLVFSDMETVDEQSRQIDSSYFGAHDMRPPRGRALGPFLAQSFAPASTIMLRRSLLGRVLPFAPEASCQDWWLALRVAETAELDWVPEALVRYRIHDGNMSAAGSEGEKWLATVREDTTFRRWMLSHLELSGVSSEHLRAAWEKVEQHAVLVASRSGTTLQQELPVTPADRRAWRSRIASLGAARDRGDRRAAALSALAALTSDPFDPIARAAFSEATEERLPSAPAIPPSRPRVSVILCAYNYERFLGQAIDSALAQDHPSFEVIVVDDGSTDGTPDVIAGYGDAVRSIRRTNGGLNAATDTGIAAARGDYLTFLDADDTWPRGRLRRLADVLDARPDVGLVYGDMSIVDVGGRPAARSFRAAMGITPRSGRILGELLWGNVVSAGSMMVRAALKPLYHPIGEQAAHQDWWIACRVATQACILAIDDVVNRYRRHGDNMNLGADAPRTLGLLAKELRFRRWLLTTTDPALVTVEQLVAALANFDATAEVLAHGDMPAAAAVLGSDRPAALAAMGSASSALDLQDLASAAVWLVRAAAHDPVDAEPRDLLRQLVPLLDEPRPVAA